MSLIVGMITVLAVGGGGGGGGREINSVRRNVERLYELKRQDTNESVLMRTEMLENVSQLEVARAYDKLSEVVRTQQKFAVQLNETNEALSALAQGDAVSNQYHS